MITNYKSRNLSIVFVLLIHFLNIETNAQSLALDANVSDSKTTEIEKDSTGITKETELSQAEELPDSVEATGFGPNDNSNLPIVISAAPCEGCGGDDDGDTGGGGTGDGGTGGGSGPPVPTADVDIIRNSCEYVKLRINNMSAIPSDIYWFAHSDNLSDAKLIPEEGIVLLRLQNTATKTTHNIRISANTQPAGFGSWSEYQSIRSNYVVNQNLPTVYNMTGNTEVCSGNGGIFGISDTQSGVKYTLKRKLIGSTVYTNVVTIDGNGNAKNFPKQTGLGTYKVTAHYGSESEYCRADMLGSKTLSTPLVIAYPKVTIQSGECVEDKKIFHDGFDDPLPYPGQETDDPKGPSGGVGPDGSARQMWMVGTDEYSTTGTIIVKNGSVTVSANDTYYVRTKQYDHTGECWGDAVPVIVSGIGDVVQNPLVSVSQNYCGPRVITVQEISKQRYEWVPSGLLEEIAENQFQVEEGGIYSIKAIKTEDCVMERSYNQLALITSYPKEKSISGGGSYYDNPEKYNRITLTDPESDVEYKIYRENNFIEVLGGSQMRSNPITSNGSYVVKAVRSVDPSRSETEVCVKQMPNVISITDAQHLDMNYKKTRSFNVPVLEEHISAVDQNDKIESITYFDGLGRPVQSMVENASPSGQDLVYHTEYDDLGRQQQSFMPYVANYDQEFQSLSQAVIDQHDFYQTATDMAHDSRPFTEVQYDGSPLNRVKSSLGAGEDWHSANKKSSIQYLSNDLADAVINWSVTDGELIASGIYAAKELHKTLVINEDEKQAITFTNKWGQVLLKKIQAPEADGGWAMTYYVYDDYGNLTVVIPPEAVKLVQN